MYDINFVLCGTLAFIFILFCMVFIIALFILFVYFIMVVLIGNCKKIFFHF